MAGAYLILLAWVLLISTSAYKCKQHTFDYKPVEYPSYPNQGIPEPHEYQETFEVNSEIARSGGQRVNERSIAVHDAAQTVHEPERVRIPHSRTQDGLTRIENGSYKILNYFPSIASRGGHIQDSSVRDRVIFPGPTSKSSQQPFVPEIPDDCKKIGICENVPNYPKEDIAKIIAQLGDVRLNIDELDTPEIPDIAQRLGPQEESMELCVFTKKIIYPESAQDKDGVWRTVLNQKENPLQGFQAEICETNPSPCSSFVVFQTGYEARCEQKYTRRTMTIVDNGETLQMNLKVPSCCSCIAKLSLL